MADSESTVTLGLWPLVCGTRRDRRGAAGPGPASLSVRRGRGRGGEAHLRFARLATASRRGRAAATRVEHRYRSNGDCAGPCGSVSLKGYGPARPPPGPPRALGAARGDYHPESRSPTRKASRRDYSSRRLRNNFQLSDGLPVSQSSLRT